MQARVLGFVAGGPGRRCWKGFRGLLQSCRPLGEAVEVEVEVEGAPARAALGAGGSCVSSGGSAHVAETQCSLV